MTDVVLNIEGLNKKFCRSLKRSMLYGTVDAMMDMANIHRNPDLLRKKEFWALKDINFELKRGETLGLIGQNGCGKTTLLRLINGIFPPDSGKITIKGRIGALIAVGAGFHPYMSGRENIYLNGTILGMNRLEIKRKFDEIVDFAEIGEFLDAPVATYSSGMTVRLGFAIAIHCDPDILLIDEILAVGDVGYQLKCFNKIGELRQQGVSTLLVSHDLHNMSTYANKILLINKGHQVFLGEVSEGLSIYKKEFEQILHSEGEIEKVNNGTNYFEVKDISFSPKLVNNKIEINLHDDLTITIRYISELILINCEFDVAIYLQLPGPHYFQSNNETYKERINLKKGEGELTVIIKNLNLNNINAHLHFALWSENKSSILVWWRKIPVYFKGNPLSTGWGYFDICFND